MKRLFSLLTMIVVMTGMVMAQSNTATTSQNGNNNSATQDQSGNSNTAEVTQGMFQGATDSEGATAIQSQEGNENSALIKQRDWANPGNLAEQQQTGDANQAVSIMYNGANESFQLQEGDGNWSKFQTSNGSGNYGETQQMGHNNAAFVKLLQSSSSSAEVMQDGDGNQAEVDAQGSGNMVDVDQTGTGNKVGMQPWYANEGITIDGDDNMATQTQDGSNNEATYSVFGYSNEFTGEQTGDMNKMFVNQSTWYDVENYGNVINASQTGDENLLDAKLKGDDNTLDFTQTGNSNVITGLGGNPFMYEGDYSDIDIEQINDNNTVQADIQGTNQDIDVWQKSYSPGNTSKIEIDASLGGGTASQSVSVRQDGTNNMSDVYIKGNGNTIEHDQPKDKEGPVIVNRDNKATTNIWGSGNSATIYQEGDANMAEQNIWGSGNSASTHQDGGFNEAFITQKTGGNTALQVQDGYYYGGTESKWDNNEADHNYSNILQEGGSANMAKSYQSGDQNWVDIHQDGSGNSAIVDQGLWDQRFTPGVHGSMNEATIMQTGTGHSTTILQNGNSNTANITQSN